MRGQRFGPTAANWRIQSDLLEEVHKDGSGTNEGCGGVCMGRKQDSLERTINEGKKKPHNKGIQAEGCDPRMVSAERAGAAVCSVIPQVGKLIIKLTEDTRFPPLCYYLENHYISNCVRLVRAHYLCHEQSVAISCILSSKRCCHATLT